MAATDVFTSGSTARLHSLDVIRGLAALSVAIFHWSHFFYSPLTLRIDGASSSSLPFYFFLWPIYKHGELAVDLFFLISGFIFFNFYSKAISDGAMSLRKFAALRLSRLYPLHLATLLITAILQLGYKQETGSSFVYQANDFPNFVLQLFFASNWLPSSTFSFNGPSWSVSIEVLLYGLFYFLCQRKSATWVTTAALAALGLLISVKYPLIGHGITSFYAGGIVYFCSKSFSSISKEHQKRVVVALVAGLGLAIAIALMSVMLSTSPIGDLASRLIVRILGTNISAGRLQQLVFAIVVRALVFPQLLLLVVIADSYTARYAKFASWVGNISYSSYLLHFPLQLIAIFLVARGVLEIDFSSNWFFLAFLAVLVSCSIVTFMFLERPVQNYLRRRFAEVRNNESQAKCNS